MTDRSGLPDCAGILNRSELTMVKPSSNDGALSSSSIVSRTLLGVIPSAALTAA